ncbi:DUF3152 domain-containing protein [Streptomyces sp. NPDC058284]|uniref:DUF3152 domain-containing protein n=1 Tax=unclassified Streptomyces TaxID=2593676 RepID=UPI0036483642
MGRHSRRGPADTTDNDSTSGDHSGASDDHIRASGMAASPGVGPQAGAGSGRRRRAPGADGASADSTPAHGMPRATPPHGIPHVRGGHPEQRESGVPGPRQDYVAAFPDDLPEGFTPGAPTAATPKPDTPAPATPTPATPAPATPTPAVPNQAAAPQPASPQPGAQPPRPRDPYASVTEWDGGDISGGDGPGSAGDGKKGGRGRRRAFAGIGAVAVTTVLVAVVSGQFADGAKDSDTGTKAAPGGARDTEDPASRSDRRPTPAEERKAAPETYEQKMAKTVPMDPKLKASGDFEVVPGFAKAPGKGQRLRYRVDIEKGLGLDGELFAQAAQKTLNDDRSWAHGGARTFERISSGHPDFVLTLASPGTTAAWCAKSGLDTTQDNVSCDSAATDRVMINAYRWAQGAKTYGDAVKKKFGSAIYPYRQMLLNHEVGHRLGHNHTDCTKDGALAPVMQQQTKFLEHDGIKCKANPWVFPKS